MLEKGKRTKHEREVSRVWYRDNKRSFSPLPYWSLPHAKLNPFNSAYSGPSAMSNIVTHTHTHSGANVHACCHPSTVLHQRAADIIKSPVIHEYLVHSSLKMQFDFKVDLTGLKRFTFLLGPLCIITCTLHNIFIALVRQCFEPIESHNCEMFVGKKSESWEPIQLQWWYQGDADTLKMYNQAASSSINVSNAVVCTQKSSKEVNDKDQSLSLP